MSLVEFFMLVAVITGPISAVFVTRWLDDRRNRRERRMNVFRTLMRTRQVPTTAEHVGALNLIEIEFAKDGDVLVTWKDLFQHFAANHTRRDEEEDDDHKSVSERRIRDERFRMRLSDERQRLLAKLLHRMASALNFKIEQLEIFEGGYTPQGWYDDDLEQRIVRRFLVDLYAGKVALPVMVYDQANPEGALLDNEMIAQLPIKSGAVDVGHRK